MYKLVSNELWGFFFRIIASVIVVPPFFLFFSFERKRKYSGIHTGTKKEFGTGYIWRIWNSGMSNICYLGNTYSTICVFVGWMDVLVCVTPIDTYLG